jgi:prolyl-tRNA synthetase
MKQSKLLISTLREVPRDADVVSQQLMLRAGMLQKLSAGIYDYLPLALRSIRKFEEIVREELNRDGCQELLMPTVQPAELWQESGRWQFYGKELLRFKDRKDNDFCLGPTHEEVITDIVRKNVKSYKQLPMNLYQIQTKFRDEIRPRFGLMRGREFIMKDGYSFHVDDQDADREYWVMFNAYKRIFSRLGVKFRPVEADSGAIGGSFTHEFHVLAGSGEDAILSCTGCDYTSNTEKTEAPVIAAPAGLKATVAACGGESPKLLKDHFATPGIVGQAEQVAAMKAGDINGIDIRQSTKFYLFRVMFADESTKLIGAVLRGDHEVNPVKVKNWSGAMNCDLMPIEEAERFTGAKSGFMGPLGLKDVSMVIDRSLEGLCNLSCGANKTDYHHFGFDPGRDLGVAEGKAAFADIRLAVEGDACPRCGTGVYEAFRGIEVGQVFKLGTKYSKTMNCTFQDVEQKEQLMVMGCYGIGVTRTVAAAIEQNYDADGIIWPWPIAPYQIHLVNLDPAGAEVAEVANRLEKELEAAGYEVLHDERADMSPGAKFKDADLLGFPLRVTVGSKGLKDGIVELRDRRTKEVRKCAPGHLLAEVNLARDKILRDLEEAGGR